jgi:MFS family permease
MDFTVSMISPSPKAAARVPLTCAVAAFGGFPFGFDQGTFTGAQIFINQYFHMTPLTFGCTTSAMTLGGLLATAGGLWMQEHLGARKCLSVAAIFLTVGSLGAATASNAAVLAAFRMLSGMGIGIISIASPTYIAEIAPSDRRGRLVLLYQLLLAIGSILGFALSWLLTIALPSHLVWRCLLGSTVVPSLILLLLSRYIPAGPRLLLIQSRVKEGSWRDLLGPGIRWALLTGVLLGVFGNWTGGAGIGPYLPLLFQRGGFPAAGNALAVVLLLSCVFLGFMIISIRLVDCVGRRTLWMSTAGAMALSMASLGLAFHNGVTGPLIVGLILLIVMCHGLGLGPLPWLMISELYAGPLRTRAISLCTAVMWLSGFAGVLMFPPLAACSQHWIGSIAGPFWIYAAMSLLALIFGWRLLPETRGKTLEEVARHFYYREQMKERRIVSTGDRSNNGQK